MPTQIMRGRYGKLFFLTLQICMLHIRKVKSEHCPWMTNEIKNLVHHKFYLKQKAVKFNSSNYHEAYKRCRNELNKRSKQLRFNFTTLNYKTVKIVKKVGIH